MVILLCMVIFFFSSIVFFFFFNDTATTEIYTPLYTLSLHDALPTSSGAGGHLYGIPAMPMTIRPSLNSRSEEHTSELQSHSGISYAVFCLKKKKKQERDTSSSCLIIKKKKK